MSEKAEKNPDSKELSYNLSHDADDRISKPYEGMFKSNSLSES